MVLNHSAESAAGENAAYLPTILLADPQQHYSVAWNFGLELGSFELHIAMQP